MWDIDSLSVAMLTRFLSYGVIAGLQSLDCLRGGSFLTVVGVSLDGSGGRGPLACIAHAVEERDRVGSCNLQLHCQSVCDWPVYWSVQSLETTVLTLNCFCVMSLYLSRIAHVELEDLMRQSLVVQFTTAL